MRNWIPFTFQFSLFLFALTASLAQNNFLPDQVNVAKPVPEPAAQVGWDIFVPPVSPAISAQNLPILAEWTRSGAPDENLILTGNQFSTFTGTEEGKDTQFIVYGQTSTINSTQLAASIQGLDTSKAAVTLPAGLPARSMYFLWPKNASGYGNPIAINHTDVWWINTDRAARGDIVSVYGRNLSNDAATPLSWVYLKPSNQPGQWIKPMSANPYRVQFIVPESVSNGTYEVWLHNGHGGSYGWGGPISLSIKDVYSWNGSTFNVKDYGAAGNGIADDSDAVQTALIAAMDYRDRTGLHPTLYFPEGRYGLRHGVSLQHDLRYLGSGKDTTVLFCNSAFDASAANEDKLALLIGKSGGGAVNIVVRDLTVDANGHTPTGGYVATCDWYLGATDQSFANVRFKSMVLGIGCLALSQANRISITDCEFQGGELFTHHSAKQEIRNCVFLNANNQLRSIGELCVSEFSITDSKFMDYDINSPRGRGQGRLLAGSSLAGSQEYAYIANNETINLGPEPDDNAGEQILCEGPITYFQGHPTSTTATSLSFGNPQMVDNLLTAIVISGKGAGQTRKITYFDALSKTITVSPVWNVTPDTNSTVLVGTTARRWVIYQNKLQGRDYYASSYTAMAGVELYGGCHEWIVDHNSISKMRHGLYNTCLQQVSPVPCINPGFFNLFTNNGVSECYDGVFDGAGLPANSPSVGLASIGNLYRRNTFDRITTDGFIRQIWADTPNLNETPVDFTLIEHNSFTNLPAGADLDYTGTGDLSINTVFYKNSFTRGTASVAGSFGIKLPLHGRSILNQNTWNDFSKIYSGPFANSVLEIPLRVFNFSPSVSAASVISVPIQNAGIASLEWSAKSDSAWLKLSTNAGTVGRENTGAGITLNADPGSLPPGEYEAVITVTSATETKKLGVTLTIGNDAPSQAHINVIIR